MPYIEEHVDQLRVILKDMAQKMEKHFPVEGAMLLETASASSHG